MAILIVLIIIALIIFALMAWLIYRSVGLYDDVRFISDCMRFEHRDVKYRRTPTWLIVVLILLPLIVIVLLMIALFADASMLEDLSTYLSS